MNTIRGRLREARLLSEKKQIGGGAYGKIPQSTTSTWEANPPKQLLTLRMMAQRYKTTADYLLGLTDNPLPSDERELPSDQQSILEIMRKLPEQRREEVIRLAEVVLDSHRKSEDDESSPSLFERVKKKYESGDDFPRIIGEEEDKESDTTEADE